MLSIMLETSSLFMPEILVFGTNKACIRFVYVSTVLLT